MSLYINESFVSRSPADHSAHQWIFVIASSCQAQTVKAKMLKITGLLLFFQLKAKDRGCCVLSSTLRVTNIARQCIKDITFVQITYMLWGEMFVRVFIRHVVFACEIELCFRALLPQLHVGYVLNQNTDHVIM